LRFTDPAPTDIYTLSLHDALPIWLQFHPEVTHTEHGFEILTRFVRDICGCPPTWTAQNIIADHVERVRRKVGGDRVLLALSGGVDRKSTRLNSSHVKISYAVFCLK